MIYLLSYPRSGQHLLKHMLVKCRLNVYVSHEIQLYKEWPLKSNDKLILLVRDFKECLVSHSYRSNNITVDKRMIDNMFGAKFAKEYRAMQYIENLVLFDVAQCSKIVIYYEDMLIHKNHSLFPFVNRNFGDIIFEEASRLDWDKEAEICFNNYDGVKLSGGKLKHHATRITDVPYLTHLVKSMNPYIYNKYLTRYE